MQRQVSLHELQDVHGIEVVDAYAAQIVHKAQGWQKLLLAVSNALVGNPLLNPAIKVDGYIEVKAKVRTLVAVAGYAEVTIDGRKLSAWRALPLQSGSKVRVEAIGEPVFVAFSGLQAHQSNVLVGLGFQVSSMTDFDGSLFARYVPQSLLQTYLRGEEEIEELIQRVVRHIRYACEMAKCGAKLVKVKVGDKVYEMWVKELD